MRFGLRTLFVGISLPAIGWAALVAPGHRLTWAISEWKKRDVVVVTGFDGPKALASFCRGSSLFARPFAAHVRIQGVDETTVRCLGRNIAIEDLPGNLFELQNDLEIQFGLACPFVLVLDKPYISGTLADELVQFSIQSRMNFIVSTCGTGDFH